MKKLFIFAIALMTCAFSANAELKPATFENEEGGIQVSAENPVWKGFEPLEDEENEWKSGSFTFSTYQDNWGESGIYYYDVTVSNLQNTTFSWINPNFDQYAAAGKAAQGNNYAVWYYSWYGPANVVLDEAQTLTGMAVTNNTYALDAILNGDGMSEEEGGKGLPFHAGDYFKLIITGYLNEVKTNSVEFYLADFRATTPGEKWYYAENWQWVDLSSLGQVDEIGFAVETTKTNTYGGTTPSYFCFDNLGGTANDCTLGAMTEITIPKEFKPATFENEEGGIQVSAEKPVWKGVEPLEDEENEWTSGSFTFSTYQDNWGESGIYYYDVTVSNLQNTTFSWTNPNFDQYAAAGKAAQGNNYAVWYYSWYGPANVVLDEARTITGMAVTNNTYALDAILNGDGMSEEEGGKGLPFHAADYLKLIVTGYLNETATNSVEFYLADFRATEAGEKWYYAENWQWVDLSSLGQVDEIGFAVETTKTNTYGATTPLYFCFDNLGGAAEDCTLGEMTEVEIPTGLMNTTTDVKVTKVIRDGQVLIIRDGKAINLFGVEL